MQETYKGPPFVHSLGRKVPELFRPTLGGSLLAVVLAAITMVLGIWALPQAGGALIGIVALVVSVFMCKNVETITVYVDEEAPFVKYPVAIPMLRHSTFLIGASGAAWAISDVVLGAFFIPQLPLLVAGLLIVQRWANWNTRERRKAA